MSLGFMHSLCLQSSHALDYRHNCLVVYQRRIRDLWRKTYWVACINCDRMHGPHRERADAWRVADAFNAHDQLPSPTTPATAGSTPRE